MALGKSFALLATTTASTKRPPAIAGGKRGAAVTNVAALTCLPLYPVDAELRERLHLAATLELLATIVDNGVDVAEGDILTVSSVDYPVRRVENWYWRPNSNDALLLVVEDIKAGR